MSRTRRSAPVAWLALALACAGVGLGPFAFEATRHADHPLVGRVWSREANGPIAWSTLERRAAAARFVLLGETHDNPDHHRLQARVIARIARGVPAGRPARGVPAGRPEGAQPPGVVFEMLALALQDEIDAFLASPARDPDAFAGRVGWERSGWPPFALYRPVFQVVLDAGLSIFAAGLTRAEAGAGQGPEREPRFGLPEPLPPARQAALVEEMFASHCELIPREALGPLVEIQRARDARMAWALLRAAEARGSAVLVAGAGHVARAGVPAVLERAGVPRDQILSLAFLEVDPALRRVEDTAAAEFDLAVFTPAAEREDPCESMRRSLAAAAPETVPLVAAGAVE